MEFAIVIEGIRAGSYIGDLSPEKVAQAASRALNKIAAQTRTRADRTIRESIAFPARYLGPASKRLWVQQKASAGALEAVVRGQGRPTSLATFSKDRNRSRKATAAEGGVSVMVKQGQTKFIKRGFIITLNNNNLGLAVRTDGGPPDGAYKPKRIGKNLWLLYGPSVDQALLNSRGEGIYEDLSPEVLLMLETEFNRLIELETR